MTRYQLLELFDGERLCTYKGVCACTESLPVGSGADLASRRCPRAWRWRLYCRPARLNPKMAQLLRCPLSLRNQSSAQ